VAGAPSAVAGVGPERALVWTIFCAISPCLPLSPRISPYLPVSPRISPYLPISPRVSRISRGGSRISGYLSRSLPVSPSLPRYPAVSRGIPPYLAMDTVKNIVQTSESSVWPFEALSARTRHSPHPTHGAHATPRPPRTAAPRCRCGTGLCPPRAATPRRAPYLILNATQYTHTFTFLSLKRKRREAAGPSV
jgi:hypothetical protein